MREEPRLHVAAGKERAAYDVELVSGVIVRLPDRVAILLTDCAPRDGTMLDAIDEACEYPDMAVWIRCGKLSFPMSAVVMVRELAEER